MKDQEQYLVFQPSQSYAPLYQSTSCLMTRSQRRFAPEPSHLSRKCLVPHTALPPPYPDDPLSIGVLRATCLMGVLLLAGIRQLFPAPLAMV